MKLMHNSKSPFGFCSFLAIMLAFGHTQAETITNSYSVIQEIAIGGSESYYVPITTTPGNAIISNVEAKFDFIAYGVVQNFVSARFNKGSDPGNTGGVTLVSQGNLPEGNPGSYGWVSFNNWSGQTANSNYYFRFTVGSGSPYTATINTIYVRITYNIPDPPTLQSPSNGSEIIQGASDIVFDWTDVSGGSNYEIWIDNNSGFGSPEVGFNNGQSSNWIADGMVASSQFNLSMSMQNQLPQNLYYWKARAIDASQNPITEWSATRTFLLLTPQPPTLQVPSNGYELIQGESDLMFDWTNVSGVSNYEIWIDNNSGFGSPEVGFNNGQSSNWITDGMVASSQFNLSLMMQNQLPQNLYYWQVRALNSSQNPISDWSPPWTFTMNSVPTPLITVVFPNGGETLYKDTDYEITWDSSDLNGNVKVEIYKNGSLYEQLGADEFDDGSCSFNPPASWPDGSDYQVAIAALDGSAFDFSDGNFTISSFSIPDYPAAAFYWQDDPIWNTDVLGTDACTETVGEYGCVITCLAMLLEWESGSSTNYSPGELNTWLANAANGGFSGCLLNWFPSDHADGDGIGLEFQQRYVNIIDAWTIIDGELDGLPFNPIMVEVDGTPENLNDEWLQHFVIVYDRIGPPGEPSSYLILDPLEPTFNPGLTLAKYSRNDGHTSNGLALWDGTFPWERPSLILTSPIGGEIWMAGNTYAITWESNHINGGIQIQPYIGTLPLENIATEAPNINSFSWSVPNNYEISGEYRIGISAHSGTVYHFSNPFTIQGGAVGVVDVELPTVVKIFPPKPNPFNPSTTIHYELSNTSNVNLCIYDLVGREAIILVNTTQSNGQHTIQWDGRTSNGESVEAGIYIAQIRVGEIVQTVKMVYLP